jgi:hypothetical protein
MTCFRFETLDPNDKCAAWVSDPTELMLPSTQELSSSFIDFSLRKAWRSVPENAMTGAQESEKSMVHEPEEATSSGAEMTVSSDSSERLTSERELTVAPKTKERMGFWMRDRFYTMQLLTKSLAIHYIFLYATVEESKDLRMTTPQLTERLRKRIPQENTNFIIRDDLRVKKPRFKRQLWDEIIEKRRARKVTYTGKKKEDPIERAKRRPIVDETSIFQKITSSLPNGDTTLLAEDLLDITSDLQDLILEGREDLGQPAQTL